jgi:RimJ/RimL family protein N-acetyltransferase
MLFELDPTEFDRARGLLAPLDYNLSLPCLTAGKTPGRIFVDDPAEPKSVFVSLKFHLFAAGDAENEPFKQAVRQLITETIIPEAVQDGRDAFIVHVESGAWEKALDTLLEGMYPLTRMRQYYACTQLKEDWRTLLPEGFALLPVDTALTVQAQLENLDELLEEMCSERPTVEDFLAQSFGFCVRHADALVSWCLSEYNTDGRCEVGIATVGEYQRRGLGTVTALALVEHALQNGYHEVGWHCWSQNVPSGALALRSGFAHVRDYPVYLCAFELGVQFAMHGYEHTQQKEFSDALAWYEKAFAAGKAPAWAHVEAARSLVKLDQPDGAVDQLAQARESGFGGMEYVQRDPDFTPLHSHPGWAALS